MASWERYFDIQKLSHSELSFELKVRGVTVREEETEEFMRLTLKKLIDDKSVVGRLSVKTKDVAKAELGYVKESLLDVQKTLNEIRHLNDPRWPLLVTRFIHYKNRLSKTEYKDDACCYQGKKDECTSDSERLYTQISQKYLQLDKINSESEKKSQILALSSDSSSSSAGTGQPTNTPSSAVAQEMTINNLKMKTPTVEPPSFDGKSDVEEFLVEYNLAADLNNWSDEVKLKFIPFYLKGTAKTYFYNERKIGNVNTWSRTERVFKNHYISISNSDSVHWDMYHRAQEPGETADVYLQEKIKLLNKANVEMAEAEKSKLILFGLLPDLAARVSCMPGNNTIAGLKENIRMTEFSNYVADRSVKRMRENTVHAVSKDEAPKWAQDLIRSVGRMHMADKGSREFDMPHPTGEQERGRSMSRSDYRDHNNSVNRYKSPFRNTGNNYNNNNNDRYGGLRNRTQGMKSPMRRTSPFANRYNYPRSRTGRLIVCYNCNKEGNHIARECRAPRSKN